MPQYVPSQFTAGMGIGAQLANNAMDQSARAVAAEAAQAYATADYQNRLQDQIAEKRNLLSMRINPITGQPLEPWQMADPKTYGADIMRGIYEYNLGRANVQPGKGTLVPITPGAQPWIPPTAKLPGVPMKTSSAQFDYARVPGIYNQGTFPGLIGGTIVPFAPPPDQPTQGQ